MTFYQAATICKASKLHIRRDAWPADKWMFYQRGTWIVFPSAGNQPVCTTDFGEGEFRATDWNTMPAALAACPITPGAPIGGGPPVPGSPSFPDDPTRLPFHPGSPGAGGDGSPISLPPPNDTPGLNVRFSGITEATLDPGVFVHIRGVHLNGPYTLTGTGGTWTKEFNSGFWVLDDGHDTRDHDFRWRITASRDSGYNWTISLASIDLGLGAYPTGGFATAVAQPRGHNINSIWNEPHSSYFYDGTAKVV